MTSNTLIPSHIRSLADCVEEAFIKYKDLPAYSAIGQTKSFADIDELSYRLACYLRLKTNLKPGDRIAIQLPNLIQNPVAVYAALRAGLVVVNTNPLYTSPEMKHQFNDSGAKALVILHDFLPKYEAIKEDVGIETVITTDAAQLITEKPIDNSPYPCLLGAINQAEGLKLPDRPAISLDDTCVLQYTGGTTGVSKGAELSHANILSNCEQTMERLGGAFVEGKEILVCPLPLYHIYAFTVCMLSFFVRGSMSVLIPNPRDMDAFVKQIMPFKFTAFAGLNTLFIGLCMHEEFEKVDTSALKLTMSGGTALTAAAANLWFKTTNCSVTEGYGLSETSPVASFNQPSHERIGTVGKPLIYTDILLLDTYDKPVSDGEVGEIAIKGPQVMKGYWQRPDETAKVMTKDGYFKTGDLGLREPDGCIKIVDRLKDLIIVSGFNVYPNEVEDILTQHETVLEAAVIGKPDDKTQERVCAYITVKQEVSTDEILEHCRKSLTAYKVPKEIHVLEELPKSTVGKILRRELR